MSKIENLTVWLFREANPNARLDWDFLQKELKKPIEVKKEDKKKSKKDK